MKKRAVPLLKVFFVPMILLTLISPFIIVPRVNDHKAREFANLLASTPLPEGSAVIETICFVGNPTGTSNQTLLWAGILIKTDLSTDGFLYYYNDAHSVKEKGIQTYVMGVNALHFEKLQDMDATNYEGLFIIEELDRSAITYFDFRGH